MNSTKLTRHLTRLGAIVENHAPKHNERYERLMVMVGSPLDMRKGISLRATFLNGYGLSLQASEANYCEPRGYSTEYSSVETAIVSPAGLVNFEPVWEAYLCIPKQGVDQDAVQYLIDCNDSVQGWVEWPQVQAMSRILSELGHADLQHLTKLTKNRAEDQPPDGNLERDKAPWKL